MVPLIHLISSRYIYGHGTLTYTVGVIRADTILTDRHTRCCWGPNSSTEHVGLGALLWVKPTGCPAVCCKNKPTLNSWWLRWCFRIFHPMTGLDLYAFFLPPLGGSSQLSKWLATGVGHSHWSMRSSTTWGLPSRYGYRVISTVSARPPKQRLPQLCR